MRKRRWIKRHNIDALSSRIAVGISQRRAILKDKNTLCPVTIGQLEKLSIQRSRHGRSLREILDIKKPDMEGILFDWKLQHIALVRISESSASHSRPDLLRKIADLEIKIMAVEAFLDDR